MLCQSANEAAQLVDAGVFSPAWKVDSLHASEMLTAWLRRIDTEDYDACGYKTYAAFCLEAT